MKPLPSKRAMTVPSDQPVIACAPSITAPSMYAALGVTVMVATKWPVRGPMVASFTTVDPLAVAPRQAVVGGGGGGGGGGAVVVIVVVPPVPAPSKAPMSVASV